MTGSATAVSRRTVVAKLSTGCCRIKSGNWVARACPDALQYFQDVLDLQNVVPVQTDGHSVA